MQTVFSSLGKYARYRHIAFVVEDMEALIARLKQRGTETFSEIQYYEDSYKLCYIRGPEGIILEVTEPIK